MTKLTTAVLVATAGVGLASARQDAGRPVGPVEPRPGYPPSARAAGGASLRRIAASPDDFRGGSVADAPRVLFLRLRSAIRSAGDLSRRSERGPEALAAREEVDALVAQLEAKRDELREEVERLEARLAVRKADIAIARGELDQATATFKQAESLVRRGLTGDNTLRGTELDMQIRSAELDKRQAEAAEVELWIRHARSRFKVAEDLANQASRLVSRAFPEGVAPPTPAPSPAPSSPT